MSNQNVCNICGANYEYRAGRWVCPACGAFKPEELSNEEVTLLYNTAQKLRLCDFSEAEIEYTDIIEKFPKNPEGYWGRLLARYGIKYEEDFDGRRIPTCYAASIKSVLGDPDYEKAMSLFPESDRAYYKAQAEYIERVREEWIEKASREETYDIFLCYKDSDLAGGIDRTPDSIAVQDIYIHLIEQGYRVFYSRESLRDKVGEKYEPYIFNALSTAKVMLVYGSKPEYITSTWLKNEWTRYIKRMQAGEKLQNSLLVACDGFSPDLLPGALSSRQCFDATKRSFYIDLDKTLKKTVNAPFYAIKSTLVYKNDDYEKKNEENDNQHLGDKSEDLDIDFNVSAVDNKKDGAESQEYKVLEFAEDNFEGETKSKRVSRPLLFIVLVLAGITCIILGQILYLYTTQVNINSEQGSTSSESSEKITITFVTSNGTVVKKSTIKSGYDLEGIPSVPEKTGYTGKWSVTDFSKLTKDTTVTPIYTIQYYFINYVLNGGTNNTSNPVRYSINSGSRLSLREPTHGYYSFAGWYLDSNYTTEVTYIDTTLLKNITLYAKWYTPDASDETNNTEYLSVKFVADGVTTKTIRVKSGKSLSASQIPAVPEKSGYSGKWNITHFSNITADMTVNAVYSLNNYTITYNLNGGTNSSSNPASYTIESRNIALADPTKTGYGFGGWYSEPGFNTRVTTIDTSKLQNIALYAKWEKLDYVITYNLNGGTNNSSNPSGYTVASGSITLANPTRAGYTFKGWYSDPGFSTKVTTIYTNNPQNITIYAKWELITYTITYVLNGGTNNTSNLTSYTINSSDIALLNPSRNGYTFKGWYEDYSYTKQITSIDVSAAKNITVYAKWEKYPFVYTIDSGEVTITGYQGSDVAIIPSEIEGLPVTAIGEGAFRYERLVKSVSIPESVKTIGNYAFNGCSSLEKITIPKNVESIGDHAFYDCEKLARVIIPDNVITIGSWAFYGCENLISVTLGKNLFFIGDYAFYDCDLLFEVYNLSSYLTITKGSNSNGYVGYYALDIHTSASEKNKAVIDENGYMFYDKNGTYHLCGYSGNEVDLILPENCEQKNYVIGKKAFYFSDIESIIISSGVISIEEEAFYYCSDLISITIGENVNFIGKNAFYSCDKLDSVTFIDKNGWYYASNPTAVSGTNINEAHLSSTTASATLLTSFSNYYWFKK